VIALKQRSLSLRLLLALVLTSLLYSVGIGWLTIRDSVDEIYELFDVHLAQTGLALLRVTDPDEEDFTTLPSPGQSPDLHKIFGQWPELPQRLATLRSTTPGQGQTRAAEVLAGSTQSMHSQYEKSLRYQVWGNDGQLILRSANAPISPMTEQEGLSESTDDQGQVWKHFAAWDRHHDFRVVVSEDNALRSRLVRNIALHLASPVVIGLPVLIVLLWFSINRGLIPLNKLTSEIEARKPDNLAPLDETQVPNEVRPMIVALNHLLLRMVNSLEGERRFTANAAHALRTPLAAIQAQVFVVRSAHSDQERQRALDQLQRGVERGIRLVSQMLTMARLDPQQPPPDHAPVILADVVQEVCAVLAPLALERHQTLELDAQSDLEKLSGNADMVSMLVSNLIDNAIRYTQDHGLIHVHVLRDAGALCVKVSDNGPGIPVHQRNHVFERFFRLAQSDQPGTGLGLSICQRIAELHGAALAVGEGLHGTGTTVTVRFGALTA